MSNKLVYDWRTEPPIVCIIDENNNLFTADQNLAEGRITYDAIHITTHLDTNVPNNIQFICEYELQCEFENRNSMPILRRILYCQIEPDKVVYIGVLWQARSLNPNYQLFPGALDRYEEAFEAARAISIPPLEISQWSYQVFVQKVYAISFERLTKSVNKLHSLAASLEQHPLPATQTNDGLETLEKNLSRLSRRVAELETYKATTNKHQSTIEIFRESFQQIRQSINSLSTKVTGLEQNGQTRPTQGEALEQSNADLAAEVTALEQSYNDLDAKFEDLEKNSQASIAQFKALEQSNAGLSDEVETLKKSSQASIAKVEALEHSNTALSAEVAALKESRKASIAKVEALEQSNAALSAALDRQKNNEIPELRELVLGLKKQMQELKQPPEHQPVPRLEDPDLTENELLTNWQSLQLSAGNLQEHVTTYLISAFTQGTDRFNSAKDSTSPFLLHIRDSLAHVAHHQQMQTLKTLINVLVLNILIVIMGENLKLHKLDEVKSANDLLTPGYCLTLSALVAGNMMYMYQARSNNSLSAEEVHPKKKQNKKGLRA